MKKEKSEYDQKVLDIRRVARVVAGGRRFSFRATVVVGNKKGKVGVGVAKGPDVSTAVEKAAHQGRKNLIVVPISKRGSIPYEVAAKYSAARALPHICSLIRSVSAISFANLLLDSFLASVLSFSFCISNS